MVPTVFIKKVGVYYVFITFSSILLSCICPTGYTGDLCDTDLDACELVASPCYPSVLCVDTPAPADHTGYT